MSYVAIVKALYDYEAQDPAEELSFKEDQVLYVIDKEDDQWWKAKLRPEDEVEEKVGLVPASYVEESQPISHARVLYSYESTSEDELSVEEENVVSVYEHQGEWDLVKVIHPTEGAAIGFVPANYTEALQPGEAEDLGLAKGRLEEGGLVKEVDPEEPISPGVGAGAGAGMLAAPIPKAVTEYATPAERVTSSHHAAPGEVKDEVETWSISELDKKGKKKKGTLGVGNGAIFFASETDKTPVQQFPIDTLLLYSTPSSKTILFQFATAPEPLQYHCGDKATTDAIMAKIRQSKDIAAGGGAAPPPVASPPHAEGSPSTRGVRFSAEPATAFPPPPRRAASSAMSVPKVTTTKATALYDFEAQGEDELTITDGEDLTVVDKENDDWWTVRNASGQQGVVPAQYVELVSGAATASASTGAPARLDSDDESVDDGAAARQAEQQAEAERRERERREMEEEAEEERRRAEDEAARRAEKERRRAERDRKRREEEAARRREAARQAPPPEPPKLKQRPSANDVAAARNLSIPKGRDAPDRPRGGDSGSGKNRPNPSRTRVWHDKSGQFRVEAEFLGMGNGKIRLHKLNGVVIEVPLEKMSPEDVAYLKKVTRKERERSRSARDPEDDMPLAQVVQTRSPAPTPSAETRARMSPPIFSPPPTAAPPQQAFRPKRSNFDWFEFFLSAGCDMDDCTRYAGNFDKDRIDESILPELDPSTLRSLGLREGDVIRVKKAIAAKYRKHTPEELDQIKKDEELAKQLQDEESRGGGSSAAGRSSPATNLFTGPDGKLANNTRRGRPERKGTISSVDPSSIAAASDQLARKPSPPLLAPSPPPAPAAPEPPKPAPLLSGFDDDAWNIKPEINKAATPQPPAAPTPPPAPVIAPTPQQTSQTLSNQINNLSLNNTGSSANNNDIFSQIPQNRIVSPNATGQAMPQSYHAGLGMGNSNMSMAQIQQQQQQQQQQQPGPLAPVPANQALLNPLIPTTTGFSGFVPTRQSMNPQPTGMMNQQTGMGGNMNMMPQQTGYGGGMGMMPQQTGYMGGMAQQQTGYSNMQPQMTGYNPMQQQQQPQNAMFNQLSAIPPQKTGMPQTEQTKFDPANIFAKMKTQGGSGSGPPPAQSADKYDALRPQATGLMPLTTGYNGAMMPQQTGMGMMPQQTGMGMMSQQTGYNMGGMGMNMGMPGQNSMYMQQPQQQQQQQQTGFMGRQGGYGY